jgi:hypothetical protein
MFSTKKHSSRCFFAEVIVNERNYLKWRIFKTTGPTGTKINKPGDLIGAFLRSASSRERKKNNK